MRDRPESAVSPLVRRMNGFAARSSRSWLMGVGLLDAVRSLARSASDTPIATPGIHVLDEQLAEASAGVIRAADLVLSVFNQESELSDHEIVSQLEDCQRRSADVEAALRAIAQLALGVTSQALGTDEVMRLERAAVVVLTQASVRAPADTYALHGFEEAGLRTEVAGLLARILAATAVAAAWRGPGQDQWVEVAASPDTDLDVWFPGERMQQWAAPVKIADPAAAIATWISRWDVNPADIDVMVVAPVGQ